MDESSCRRTRSLPSDAQVLDQLRRNAEALICSHHRLIEDKDWKIFNRLGSGAFGVVYRAQWHKIVVAAKFLKPGANGELTDEQKLKLKAEAKKAASKLSKHIVAFLGYDSHRNVIVMDYYPNGTLFDFMRNPANWNIVQDLKFRLRVLEEIAAAFVWLHHQHPRMIHRDLKSSNVLLDEHLHARVGDLGLARMVDVLSNFSEIACTSDETCLMRLYQPPEVLNGSDLIGGGYSTKSDVFSYGILIQEILTLKLPYNLPSDRDEFILAATFAVRNGRLHPEINGGRTAIPGVWDPCLKSLIKLMTLCCSPNPDDRPDFDPDIYKEIQRIRLEYNTNISARENVQPTAKPVPVSEISESEDSFQCSMPHRITKVVLASGGFLLFILFMCRLLGLSLRLGEEMSATRICAWGAMSVLMLSGLVYVIHCAWKCYKRQWAGSDASQDLVESNERETELTEWRIDIEGEDDAYSKGPVREASRLDSKLRQDAPFYAPPEKAAAYPIPREWHEFLGNISKELESCGCPQARLVCKLSAQYIKDGMPDTNSWLRLVTSVISSFPAMETFAWKWYKETYNVQELVDIDPDTNPEDPFSAGPSVPSNIPYRSNYPFPSQGGFFKETDSDWTAEQYDSRLEWSDTQSACSRDASIP